MDNKGKVRSLMAITLAGIAASQTYHTLDPIRRHIAEVRDSKIRFRFQEAPAAGARQRAKIRKIQRKSRRYNLRHGA